MVPTGNSGGRRRTHSGPALAALPLALVIGALIAAAAVSARAQTAPQNTAPPSIEGTARGGESLRATTGTWTGTQPITFAFRWLRCDASGESCDEISGATDRDYVVVEKDVGRRLRVRVTARNDEGARSALSAPTAAVQRAAPAEPSGVITLPSGERSVPVGSVPKDERLIVSQMSFSPSPVTSRETPITVRIRVKDTRGFVVRDALVFIRSTPKVTSGGSRQPTATDGWVTYELLPESDFPIRNGGAVQFFVKAHRAGDPVLAGVAGTRLVQVRTAR